MYVCIFSEEMSSDAHIAFCLIRNIAQLSKKAALKQKGCECQFIDEIPGESSGHGDPWPGKKWNESGFRPPLCTYRLNWARRTSWGWWDDWDDTVLQTQDSKFEPWRSEAEHATSRSRRLPTILTFTRGWGRNNFVSFKPPRPGTEPRTLAWKAAVLTTTLGPPPSMTRDVAQQTRGAAQCWVKYRKYLRRCPNAGSMPVQ